MFNPDPKKPKRVKNQSGKINAKLVTRKCENKECSNSYQRMNNDTNIRWCSYDCAIQISKQRLLAKKKKEEKDDRIRIKKEKLDIKSITDWKNDLQVVINKIVRLIDNDYACISHPSWDRLRWDAGHYFSVKTSSDLRFNFHNIHKQGSTANENVGGGPDYLIGLRNRYGDEYTEFVLGLKLEWKGISKRLYTIENIRKEYLPAARFLLREIKKGKQFTREECNEIIGIYINQNK